MTKAQNTPTAIQVACPDKMHLFIMRTHASTLHTCEQNLRSILVSYRKPTSPAAPLGNISPSRQTLSHCLFDNRCETDAKITGLFRSNPSHRDIKFNLDVNEAIRMSAV